MTENSRPQSPYAAAIILLFLLLSSSACGVRSAIVKQEPRGFIDREKWQSNSDTVPYDHFWQDPDFVKSDYRYLYIAPVTFNHIDKEKWLASSSEFIRNGDAYLEYSKSVADYATESISVALKMNDNPFYQLVETPAPGGLTFELALTEITFGSPIGYIGLFAIPLPGMTYVFDSTRSPSLSFEAQIVDSQTGKTLITFADKRLPRVKPIADFKKFTLLYPLKEIVDLWVETFVDLERRRNQLEVVEGPAYFSISPW